MARHILTESAAAEIPRQLALASTNYGIPTISVPDVFEADGHSISFSIPTPSSAVSVRCYNRVFDAKGRAEALLYLGLVRPEWLPGIPGNNKTRQRIVFDKSGPRLLYEKTRKSSLPHITIIKLSSNLYEVGIPATGQQRALVHSATENAGEAARTAEAEKVRESNRLKNAPKNTAEFRARVIDFSLLTEAMLSTHLEQREDFYQIDNTAKAHIRKCWEEIRKVISEGRVIPMKRARHQDGNVVFLGHR